MSCNAPCSRCENARMEPKWIFDGGALARGALLLPLLPGLEAPGFRDAWVEREEDGKLTIVVYVHGTFGLSAMRKHPSCTGDKADEFDPAYRIFRYAGPDSHAEVLAELATVPVDPAARWADARRRLEKQPA